MVTVQTVETASRLELRAGRLMDRGSILGRTNRAVCFQKKVQIGAGAQPPIQRVTGTFLPRLNSKRIDFDGIKSREPRENHEKVS
jgi:hypothetical protein